MMSNTKRFLKTSGVYFLGNVFTKMISFLLLPLYTSKLDTKSFGYYDLSISLISLVVPIVFFQIWDGVFRFIFDYEQEENKYEVISNGLVIQVVGVCLYTLLVYIVEIEYKGLIYLTGISTAMTYFYAVVARGFTQNKLFVLSGTINSVISILVNVVMIGLFDGGIESLYIASVLGAVTQIIIIESRIKVLKYFKISSLSMSLIKDMLKFAIPIGVSTVAYWLLSGLTRLTITASIGVQANGLYAVANKFGSILVLGFGVFEFAWNELSYTIVKDVDKHRIYETGANLILKVLLMGTAIALPAISMLFPYIINEQYHDANTIIPPVILGVVANSYASFLGTIFLANKNSFFVSISTICSAIINMLALSILVPLFGLMGAVHALMISFIANACLRMIVVKKLYNIDINLIVVLGGVTVLGMASILYYIQNCTYSIFFILIAILISLWVFKNWIKNIFGNLSK
ncbi:lipopolysaccharide biosynthesis protein [Sporanaerobium hydrogeniformans]|uniref:lipopolysaccharide biosynthesis protein n=1 Tax=Sporanaerobium hydrogeniformans TaxID=3072179 RepID=UPI0015D4706A|nr:oligosaccharide flippase family protein [Sporanaerobium hydrogeniformans]